MYNKLSIETRIIGEELTVGTYDNIFITIIKRSPSLEEIVNMISELSKFSVLHPEGIVMITVIKKTASPPAVNIRKEMSNALKRQNILFSGTVMEAEGFFAATNRAFISGLTLLASHKYPQKIFSSTKDCGNWFEKMAEKEVDSWKLYAFIIQKIVKEVEKMTSNHIESGASFYENSISRLEL